MPLGLVNKAGSPIGIDFGARALRALQLAPGDGRQVIAAARLETPEPLLDDEAGRLRYQMEALPELIKKGGFKGKRAASCVPATRTFVQNIAAPRTPGLSVTEVVKGQLQQATGMDPGGLVVRHHEIGEATRGEQKCVETLCVAMPRSVVTEQMRALKRAKLDAVGIHCQHAAMVHAFRGFEAKKERATLYVDLGFGTVKAAIACGGEVVVAKTMRAPAYGASTPAPDMAATPKEEEMPALLRVGAGGSGGTPIRDAEPGATQQDDRVADVDTLVDELGLAVRYFGAITANAGGEPIGRCVFVGGGAGDLELCTRLARSLRLPAQAGDPLSAYGWPTKHHAPGVEAGAGKPEWAVALGLCLAPTDL